MRNRNTNTSKIVVLHLVHNLNVGGAELALLQYIQALGFVDYEHHVYCVGLDGLVRQKIEKLGVPVNFGVNRMSIKRPIKFAKSLFFLVKSLLKFIRKNGVRLIQSHSGEANQLGVLIGKISGIPSFPTIHSTNPFVNKSKFYDLRGYLHKFINGIIYRCADRVIVVSGTIKQIIKEHYKLKDDKIIILQNGIIFNQNPSSNLVKSEEEFFCEQNKFKILAVGRLVPWKGFDVLVKSIACLIDNGPGEVLVLIVGEGKDRSRLEQLILELNLDRHVKLLGLRDDIINLMKFSDVMVMPSHYEGLSLAMIEAMACGLPVIASNVPGLKDHIDHGRNGLLFPAKDYEKLASCIFDLANNKELRTLLSENAYGTFTKKYDMRRNIKPLDDLFHRYGKNAKK